MNTRSFVLSALIAGAAIGLFANLPVLNLINCFLCVWVCAGGVLAVFLYRWFQHGGPALRAVQGAGLGAFAGLIGVFVGMVVYALTSFISMPLFVDVARFFQIEGDLPIEVVGPSTILTSTLIFFVLDMVAYPLFGALSGFITASLMRQEPQVQS